MFKESSLLTTYNQRDKEGSIVKDTLEELNILNISNGDVFLDFNKYKEIINNPDNFPKNDISKFKSLKYSDLISYLKNLKVKDLNSSDNLEVNALSLPNNIEEAKEGKFNDGLLYPWELKKRISLNEKIKINDNEKIGIIELYYLNKINELQFHRNENDELVYFDKDKNYFFKFSSRRAREIFERNVSINEKIDGKMRQVGFNANADYFIKNYLPVIDSLMLFKPKDFEGIAKKEINPYITSVLQELNLLEIRNEELFFDYDKFKDIYKNQDKYDLEKIKKLRSVNFKDILKYFNNLKFKSLENPDRPEVLALSLPTSIENAKKGKFEEGLLYPWQLKEFILPNYCVALNNEENVKLIDLYYLKKINELQFHRNENDELVYFDKEKSSFVLFKPYKAEEIFGIMGMYKQTDKNKVGFQKGGYSFIQNFLPLVNSLGLFKSKDFKRYVNSSEADILFPHQKPLHKNNSFIFATSEGNLQARYYIGRDKIVGTKVDKNNGNLFAVELDVGTMAILEKKYGKSRLLFEFKKLSEEEFRERGFDNINEKYRHVKGDEMKERIKEYKVSNYLPQRSNESAENYADRLSKLNDVSFVIDKFRDFMSQTNVKLRQLSWAEQLLISNYILETNNEKGLINFIKKYQGDGLRAFLAVEADLDLANKIISLDEKIPYEQAKVVFAKISEINLLALKNAEDLSQLFFTHEDDKKQNLLSSNICKHLFNKSADILNQLDQNKEKENKELINKLEDQKVEIILLSSLLKEAKEQKVNLNIEDIKNLNLNIKDIGFELTEEEKNKMLEISKANWEQFGNSKLANSVVENFEESLKNTSNQRFYVLKLKDEIVSFLRFEAVDDNTLYAGSFNVAKDLRGINVGSKMMEKALVFESQKNILKASASIKIEAACNYIENVGFVADGIIDNYNNSNEQMFNIVLNKKRNSQYNFRNEEKDEIIDYDYLKSLASKDDNNYEKSIGEPFIVLKFDLKTEFDKYQESLKTLLAKTDEKGNKLEPEKGKYTLTRFFKDKHVTVGDVRYLVFELNN